jgi:hypothetical protein
VPSSPLVAVLQDYLSARPAAIQFDRATETEVADVERALGLKIPDTLRDVYLSIGNGAFGPGGGKTIGVGRSGYAAVKMLRS